MHPYSHSFWAWRTVCSDTPSAFATSSWLSGAHRASTASRNFMYMSALTQMVYVNIYTEQGRMETSSLEPRPSVRKGMPLRTFVGDSLAGLGRSLFPSKPSALYIRAYTFPVNAAIYMKFREAVDALCTPVTHQDVAKALDVSVQTVRQARLSEDSDAFRAPPKNWKSAIIRLAEGRIVYYRTLIEKLKNSD
jgi:hypothetical protein